MVFPCLLECLTIPDSLFCSVGPPSIYIYIYDICIYILQVLKAVSRKCAAIYFAAASVPGPEGFYSPKRGISQVLLIALILDDVQE